MILLVAQKHSFLLGRVDARIEKRDELTRARYAGTLPIAHVACRLGAYRAYLPARVTRGHAILHICQDAEQTSTNDSRTVRPSVIRPTIGTG